jgi:hypothetical protein
MWPFDELASLAWEIGGVFLAILMVALYPIVVFIGTFQTFFQAIWTPIVGLINVLIGIPNLLIDLMNALFVGTLPPTWIALIMAELFVVLGLRIYSFLKDVEILGNKL